jgi:hypothetical protein
MKSMLKVLVIIAAYIALVQNPCNGQTDSTRNYKNTIRFNITNPMIFSPKYNVIGYERVIRKHQTASISIGRFALSRFADVENDSMALADQYNDKGFNFSVDYRFYLRNENKFTAPRGVYLGPYYAFNYFSRDITWNLKSGDVSELVNSNIDLTANLVGLQLGYQFILWDRLSIDMILVGPGAWFFNLHTSFDTDLAPEDEAMLLEKLNAALEDKFPGSDLVIQGDGFHAKKTTRTAAMGFRYMVNLGFRF